jgi:hypothetical protein
VPRWLVARSAGTLSEKDGDEQRAGRHTGPQQPAR